MTSFGFREQLVSRQQERGAEEDTGYSVLVSTGYMGSLTVPQCTYQDVWHPKNCTFTQTWSGTDIHKRLAGASNGFSTW